MRVSQLSAPSLTSAATTGAGDRFRARGELEYRIRINGGVLAGFAHPESLYVNHLVLQHQGDRKAGHLSGADAGLGHLVQLGERFDHTVAKRVLVPHSVLPQIGALIEYRQQQGLSNFNLQK
jgi:hypothetical protein